MLVNLQISNHAYCCVQWHISLLCFAALCCMLTMHSHEQFCEPLVKHPAGRLLPIRREASGSCCKQFLGRRYALEPK